MWELLSALLLGALVGLKARELWRLKRLDDGVRLVLKIATQSARVTSATPHEARAMVHLVLMDAHERQVEYVMQVAPEQRAYEVWHQGRPYTCVSGRVEDGYFVYRKR